MAKLSAVVPSRDERFLLPTIHDLFRNARGEFEVIAVLDSDLWPEGWKEITDQYPNLHTIHNGRSLGMRASINRGVASAISRGAKFIMKSDGHCSFSEGFDEVLKTECEPNWVVVPRRGRLDPENWVATETHKPDIDYHYLSFPDNPQDWGGKGLNGKPWPERAVERKDILLDEEMSSQGSCWFMHADYFNDLLLMDEISYGSFWNEFQEIGLKCWLSGGKVMVNKKTRYLHLHKGTKYGRGYRLAESQLQQGASFTKNWIWNDAWLKQTLPFSWLIEHFWPVPTWPDNWEEILYATRKPRLVGGIHKTSITGDGSGSSDNNVSNSRQSASGSLLTIRQAWYGFGEYGIKNTSGEKWWRSCGSCYGQFNSEQEMFSHSCYDHNDPPNWMNVTDRVRELVVNNSLDIVVSNSILQVGNPFRGKKKSLRVVYDFDGGEVVTRTVEEKDWLIIGPVSDSVYKQRQEPVIKVADVPADGKFHQVSIATATLSGEDEPKTIVLENAEVYPDNLKQAIAPVPLSDPPRTAPALNDYLIRRFSISPQRLRGPMPIELRDFHRNDLAQLFAELGFKRGAEIGVAEGNYSEVLLKANPECELLLVDPWHHYGDNPQGKSKEKHEYAFEKVKYRVAGTRAVLIGKKSMDAVRNVEESSLDFCYVDGNHLFDYCVMDIIEWSKRVRSGGIVSGDDYYALDQKRWVGGGVVEAVQAYVNAHRIPIWFLCSGHKSVDYFWCKP